MVHNLDQTLFIKALHRKLGNENLQITEIRNQSISSKAEHGLSDIFKVYLRSVTKVKSKQNGIILSIKITRKREKIYWYFSSTFVNL